MLAHASARAYGMLQHACSYPTQNSWPFTETVLWQVLSTEELPRAADETTTSNQKASEVRPIRGAASQSEVEQWRPSSYDGAMMGSSRARSWHGARPLGRSGPACT